MDFGGNDAALAGLDLGSVPEDAPSSERAKGRELPEGWDQALFGARAGGSWKIPETWGVRRLGDFASARGGTGFPPELQGQTGGRYPFFKVSDMNLPGNGVEMGTSNNYVTEEVRAKLAAKPFNVGTVIFPKVGGALHTNKKRILVSDALLDNNVMGVTIEDDRVCIPDFLLRLFEVVNLSDLSNPGPLPSINATRVKGTMLPIPPLPEQRAIASVLGAVQGAKEACEQVLATTRQLKQSLLHHLFTYGPVPFSEADRIPVKETEIGLICEHWNLVSCESLCEMLTVGVVVKPSTYYVESGVPAFRSFNVREDKLVTNDLVFFSNEANDGPLSKSRLREGDVLIVRTGYPGTSCVVPKEYDGANCIDLVIARPNRTLVLSEFLSRFFNSASGKQQALNAKVGLAQQHLNVGAVRRTLVPLPILPEQREIAGQLAAVDAKLAAEESRRAALAALFQSLLHHLMTAKVRLPEFVRA